MKFYYANQIKQARKWIVKSEIKTLQEVAEMSDDYVGKVLEEYAKNNDLDIIFSDNGESIGLVPRQGCVWFER